MSQVEFYLLPRVEEPFATLSTKACLHLPLTEDSKEFVTINTSKGLFQYNILPFGMSSAPTIFQSCIENLLQECVGMSYAWMIFW